MYFWNIKKLKADLIERPMTDKETLPYLIATSLLYLASQFVPKSAHFNALDYLELAISVLSIVVGTLWLYQQNKADAGQHFIQRYLALGWVVFIRVAVVMFPIMAAMMTILSLAGLANLDTNVKSWHDIILIIIFTLINYWYLGKQMSEVAEKATKF